MNYYDTFIKIQIIFYVRARERHSETFRQELFTIPDYPHHTSYQDMHTGEPLII